jgi:hypothetical protein
VALAVLAVVVVVAGLFEEQFAYVFDGLRWTPIEEVGVEIFCRASRGWK